jgi:hypothetical protein
MSARAPHGGSEMSTPIQEVVMSREKPQVQTLHKHPEPYQHDLNPDAMAGQNIGLGETQPSKEASTAYDVKSVHRQFREFSDAELKLLRILPEGSRLEQGATYIDLRNLEVGEFTATGEMHAGPNNWMVAKKEVPYEIWNRLRSETKTQPIE